MQAKQLTHNYIKSVYSIGLSYEKQSDAIKISVLSNFTSISNA